jgi:hypothetical protein
MEIVAGKNRYSGSNKSDIDPGSLSKFGSLSRLFWREKFNI